MKIPKYRQIKLMTKATPMTRKEYVEGRGWTLPEDENPNEPVYQVEYANGYVTMETKENFEAECMPMEAMSLGDALMAAKQGCKIGRTGWNGKGMYVVYQKGYPDGIPANRNTAEAWGIEEGELFKCEPYLQIKMVNGSHAMWVPSINDVLAVDWQIV